MNIDHYGFLLPGCVVSTDFVLGKHVGIVTGHDHRGYPLVTSNSARHGGVFEESFEEFRQGKLVRREYVPTHDEAAIIVHRARILIGRRWNLFTFNCEHFVELALGRAPKSQQVRAWLAVAVIMSGIYVAIRSR